MSDIAIRVDGLGKSFRLRHQGGGARYRTLREDLVTAPRAFWARLRRRRAEQEEFWALKDVSFEVKRGEVLGIIGRNGAGKSTLLKILSRIIDPTEGEATVYGRVGSLLEVGTGFHPELTGRENIYLSGALLGMKRAEVRRRFDEIVEFAGVQKFLDTPCKHYSSGMYTRLGFAVAAHLDTEILLVDEVLAVGDVEFQRKCIEKMGKVSQGGRTIILVSHDLGVIRRLVHKCIWIDASRLVLNGPPIDVTDAYLKPSIQAVSASGCAVRFDGAGRDIWFSEARLAAIGGSTSLSMGDSALLSFELQSKEDCADKPVCLAVGLRTEDGAPVSYMVDTDSGFRLAHGVGRSCRVSVRLADLRLYPGLYFIRLWAGSHNGLETYDDRQDCLVLNVADTGRLSQRRLLRSQGVFFMQPEWRICV